VSRLWQSTVNQVDALRDAQVEDGCLYPYARAFRRRLRDVDPLLDLVRAKPRASAPGLRPNYWHVRRRNPGLSDSYMPITGPNGEYREPHDGVIEDLALRDLWRSDVAARNEPERLAAENERRQEAERQERREQAVERVRSAERTSVHVPKAV